MAPTSIFFNGRLISVPGSYTEVDASGLEVVGLGASGIVALLGTSYGGKPYSAVDVSDAKGNSQVATSPRQPFNFFREGDLREAAPLCFGPSLDPDITGGAQEIVFVKINDATQSSATFDNVDGAALVLTSEDWGYFTTQINVEIAAGTSQGKLITIVFEDLEEEFDDVGGDTIFTLQYLATTPADGFTTITCTIDSARLDADFTRTQTGLDGEVSNQVTAGQAIELLSSSGSDTAVQVRLYGTDASNQAQVATYTLTGVTVVTTTETWNSFHGAEVVVGTLVGTCTIQNVSAASTIATIAPAGTEAAVEFTSDTPVSGSVITVVADAADTSRITITGLSSTGTFQTEMLQLNGTTPVPGTALWSRIDGLALGELAAARTVTVSGVAIDLPYTSYPTIQKMADKLNSTLGFTMTVSVSNPSTHPSDELDHFTAVDIKSAAILTVTADLKAIVDKLNAESELVTAAFGSVASGPPDNTTAAVFLAGGHEGDSTPGSEGVPYTEAADWQAGFDLLNKIRVNTVVPLTGDPAVHAMALAHCQYNAGYGRSERDCFVGLRGVVDTTDVPTKTEAKSAITSLNSRHIRACAQTVERYNTSGDLEEFQAPFQAVIGAGMQAGSPVGTSLTHKVANVVKIRQDSSWNPSDDAEEMIKAGLWFMEVVDETGVRRVKRNVTTHLSTSNIAYTEGSVNEAVNYSVYNFRTTMEAFVGKSGFAGTVNAAKGKAVNVLGLLIGVSLTAWRSLDIQLILDVLEIAVEISPVIPINFVQSTIHLVAIPQSAAAA